MKTKTLIVLTAICSIGTIAASTEKAFRFPDAKVTARVVSEEGEPIPRAHVSLGFLIPDDLESKRPKLVEGITDRNGQFSGQGAADGVLGSDISIDGYYRSGLPTPRFELGKDNRWQPWGATYTATLRPIGKPVPMYVKEIRSQVPVTGQPCGYDLMKGDWVSPWGKGETADFVFTAQCEYKDYLNYTVSCKLTFPNPKDGIQIADLPEVGKNSEFRWHREAPPDNYKSELAFECFRDSSDGVRTNYVEKRYYYFRTRTQETDGKLIGGF